MNIFGPSANRRFNEAAGLVCLAIGIVLALSLASYSPSDPSWNTATGAVKAKNWIGHPGAWFSDLAFTALGLAALLLPVLAFVFGWKRLRHQPFHAPVIRVCGSVLLLLGVCTLLAMLPDLHAIFIPAPIGGVLGLALSGYMLTTLNFAGTMVVTVTAILLSLYLVSRFSMELVYGWFERPTAWLAARRESLRQRRAERRRVEETAKPKRVKKPVIEPEVVEQDLPWQTSVVEEIASAPAAEQYIPIRALDDLPAEPKPIPEPVAESSEPLRRRKSRVTSNTAFLVPPTTLLAEIPGRNPYDEQELKETASRIKSKFEEFNVFGQVVQINPGPVVTTFEFKPEAGIKYNRITQLNEDLCLGLQAESVLIERIPGKPTVGIEVPNSRREVISLRQVLESDEFQQSPSRLTITLGKDINGRIKVAAMESMPHLLIAGSTGSGKSVMLNTLIMSVLYKATPDEVRMIMVDPKRLELGLYEGVPHLLTPVITDPKKATYALRNAVLEMERRLKLLAAQQVRNIEQYNKKVKQILAEPRSLFDEPDAVAEGEELKPLPYILIIIDELADLMMLERAGVEESVTRLAQMARAVGMHLVLATQRPSVDVITGLIKANFPARISFRVATRVDSRTILDSMGAEHLLGRGDMLYLPPGSSRLVRVHGAFVTEQETAKVVDYWKSQGMPEYDQTFLVAPPNEDSDDAEAEEFDGDEDPMYRDAVKVVLELGKASTSTLQRRMRLGYGRAAHILDMMYKEGIIGPPDGSRPREVLKRPDWLEEIENQLR